MWITIDNDATERLYNDGIMDEPVEFGESRTAQVPAEVGEAMIEHYDGVSEHDASEE